MHSKYRNKTNKTTKPTTKVIGKLEKLQEPAPVKPVKRLPAPIDVPRKRRGGRRWVLVGCWVENCFGVMFGFYLLVILLLKTGLKRLFRKLSIFKSFKSKKTLK